MRGYLMLAGMTAFGVLAETGAPRTRGRVEPPAPAALDPGPQHSSMLFWVATQPAPAGQESFQDRLALESHPSFTCWIPGFPGAYMRDACLREGWDRPVTLRGPYVGDANDELTRAVMERTIELRNAEAQWRAIQEKHGVPPKAP